MAKQPKGMQVRVEKDEHGLPVVSWVEPRREDKTVLLIFSWDTFPEYAARCWIDINGHNGELLFIYQNDGVHNRQGMPPMSGTPLSNVAGFSLHTSKELHGDGATPLSKPSQNPDVKEYRDDLVLVADLKKSIQPDIAPYLPLTLTTASRSDVMALHATLTETFLINADALKPALTARQKKWKQQHRDTRWKALLKPPIISGGRKFVSIGNGWKSKPDPTDVVPVESLDKFGVFKDSVKDDTRVILYQHFFERRQRGALEYARASNSIRLYDPLDELSPELISFYRASVEGTTVAYKPRQLFKAVGLFNGGELELPQAYLAAPDVQIDASTLILCLEFSDGELLPLTYAPASERAGVEKLREHMERVFSEEGSGGGNGGSKIVL